MKKLLFTTLLLVMVSSLLAGCAQPAPVSTQAPTEPPAVEAPAATDLPTEAPVVEPIIVTDALDRTVEFDTYPTRIVIAGKAAFMIQNSAFLFPEAQERIIAYELRSQTGLDFIEKVFPMASQIQKFEMDAGPEQIAPFTPDLVMMKSYLADSLGSQLEEIGIKVVYLDLETPEAIIKDLHTLGEVFGNLDRAEQLATLYEQNTKRITDVTNKITEEEKPSVLMLQYSDKGGEIAFKVPPAEWLQTGMVEMAGGLPIWTDTPTDGWTTVTLEQIAAWNPDTIFVIDYKGKAIEATTNLKADENWALLDATINDQIFAFPSDFQSWDQPDTRWTLALTWVATKLHPDLFSSITMSSEIQAFYRDFYGLTDTQIQDIIFPLVKGDL